MHSTEVLEANGVDLSVSAIHLRSAVCLLGRYPALAGVDLDVAEGEVVLVAGPNGAGKTTLLRLLAGLLPLSAGRAVVLGHDLAADRHAVRAELALVGHAPGAYDDLTVRENVRFWVRAGGGRLADADAVLEELGLTRLAGVAFGRLSAGQQRRTGLAVALARRPRLLLLDEPHAGLDAAGRDLLDGLLRSSAGEGRTVLLVSHELDRARALADREVTIVAGAIRPQPQLPSGDDERSDPVNSGGTPGPPALPHRAEPDQLPPPERLSLP
jgi:heme ABC exporter ATP-binding subunit CcmA